MSIQEVTMSKHGRYERKKEKKSLGWKKILLIVVAIVLVLMIGLVIFAISSYNSILNLIPRASTLGTTNSLSDEELIEILGHDPNATLDAEEPLPPETMEDLPAQTTAATEPDYGESGKIVNIMLIGQSYRDGEETKLADTMILCTLNKETKTVTLTSFLRDMYIKLPDFQGHTCGKNRINVCYNLGWRWAGELGGMMMLNQLMQENFGVEVDYNVEINFDAFQMAIDLMGGIEVELTEEEAEYLTTDWNNDGEFTAGVNVLDGDSALAYARMRKSNGSDSDIKRASRQRDVINMILQKCKTLSMSELYTVICSVLPMIITDMTNEEITSLCAEVLPMLRDLQIVSNQCPAEGTYSGQMVELYGVSSGVLVPDVEKNREILVAICEEGVQPEPVE